MKAILAILLVATSCIGQMLPEEYLLISQRRNVTYTTNWVTKLFYFVESSDEFQSNTCAQMEFNWSEANQNIVFTIPTISDDGVTSISCTIPRTSDTWNGLGVPSGGVVIAARLDHLNWKIIDIDRLQNQIFKLNIQEAGNLLTLDLLDYVDGVGRDVGTQPTITFTLASASSATLEFTYTADRNGSGDINLELTVDSIEFAIKYYTED